MIPLFCSFGGKFGYKNGREQFIGGTRKIICVHSNVTHLDLVSKIAKSMNDASSPMNNFQIKYRYPGAELNPDELVNVDNDEDVEAMIMSFIRFGCKSYFEIFIFPKSADHAVAGSSQNIATKAKVQSPQAANCSQINKAGERTVFI